jgi:hypothetical protein
VAVAAVAAVVVEVEVSVRGDCMISMTVLGL